MSVHSLPATINAYYIVNIFVDDGPVMQATWASVAMVLV